MNIKHSKNKYRKPLILLIAILFICCLNVGRWNTEAVAEDVYGTSIIPTTKEELERLAVTTYSINTLQDWLNLQSLSKVTSLEGYTFTIESGGSSSFDLTTLSTGESEFTGIGSVSTPFSGTLTGNVEGVKITTKYPIFAYLSVTAKVEHMNIIVHSATSGLAQVLTASGISAPTETKGFSDIYIAGSISGDSKDYTTPAGGVFGEIVNDTEHQVTVTATKSTKILANQEIGIMVGKETIMIDGTESLYPTYIYASTAGMLVGSIRGNVKFVYDNDNIAIDFDRLDVMGGNNGGEVIGGLIGKITGTENNSAVLELQNDLTICNYTRGTKIAGGLVGQTENVKVNINGNLSIANASIAGITDAGGLIGVAKNTEIINANKIKIESSTITNATYGYENGVEIITYHNGNVGGAIGSLSQKSGTFGNIEINDLSTGSLNNIGGAIGVIESSDGQDEQLFLKNIKVNPIKKLNDSNTAIIGGVAAVINRTNVSVGESGNLTEVILQNTVEAWDFTTLGGIVGKVNSDMFTVENASVKMNQDSNNTLTGSVQSTCFGGIIGELGESTTKAKYSIKNVAVTGKTIIPNTVNNVTFGGIIGVVFSNPLVKLDGSINVSEFEATVASQFYGRIIGKKTEALCYVQPIGFENNQYSYGVTESPKFLADDIGNYGGLYRNGDWDRMSGAMETSTWLIQDGKVQGKVKKVDNSYQLFTEGDFLRLSIASATNATYGIESFTESETLTLGKVLGSNFLVMNDIDLTNTQIYALNGNQTSPTLFQGSFMSDGNQRYKIRLDDRTTYTQGYIGLFSKIRNATIKNIIIHGNIEFASQYVIGNAGLLSAQADGMIEVDYVMLQDSSVAVHGSKAKQNYGGLIGRYLARNDTSSLKISNIISNTALDTGSYQHFVGGIVGYIQLKNTNPIEIDINNITIGGSILSKVETERRLKVGGIVAQIDDGVAFDDAIDGSATKILANVKLAQLTIDGMNIKMNGPYDAGNPNGTGGFLGYSWENVNVNLDTLLVQNKATITTNLPVGGLVYRICGKAYLDNVTYKSAIFDLGTAPYSGLLVQNGQNAYISVKNYKIDGAGIEYNCSKMTDELVGYNLGDVLNYDNNGAISQDGRVGGILSIEQNDSVSEDEKLNYQHQLLGQEYKVTKTRYYYNLRTILETASIDNNVINTPEDMMAWHLVHYANATIRPFFYGPYKGTKPDADNANDNYTISSLIDLSNYSYYPTVIPNGGTYLGADNAKIALNGEKIITNNPEGQKANDRDSVHYRMHAGVFYDTTNISVSDLTLTGSVSNSAATSGALVAGTITGTSNIKNITLDSLYVYNPSENWNAQYGLMIYHIDSQSATTIESIKMKGYDAYDTNGNKKGQKVAAALIGYVGSENAQNIRLTFKNMEIADVADEVDATKLSGIHASPKDQIMAYASFIYNYEYMNNGVGIYNFTWEEYLYGSAIGNDAQQTGVVTLGSELGTETDVTTEYYDYGTLVGEDADTVPSNLKKMDEFKPTNYKPYVLQKKPINVNAKSGNLTSGCGTYEDPYIIENASQFMALYNYLAELDPQAEQELLGSEGNEWKVNGLGLDTSLCNKEEASHTLYTYGKTGFPSKQQLSSAYYQIVNNINLSSDFNGLGTLNLPFAGVIVGKMKNGETQNPIINMPSKKPKNSTELVGVDYLGVVKYGKGTVLKDIDIKYPDVNYIKINIASGAIANIVGGDNIIDNVAVVGHVHVNTASAVNKVYIGGYVGYLEKGGLILRNMQKKNLKDFEVYKTQDGANKVQYNEGYTDFYYVGGITGNVMDGYVIYDNNVINSNNPLVPMENVYENEKLLASKTFEVINGNHLEQEITKKNKIRLWKNDGKYQFDIANSAQLLVQALAINSASIYHTNSESTAYAYDYNARCRIAKYTLVGDVNDSNNEEYKIATQTDNKSGNSPSGEFKPFILGYYNIEVPILNGSNKTIFDSPNTTEYQIMKLSATDSIYDLSGYGTAFHGIGARHNQNFRMYGTFDGNNNTIKVKLLGDITFGDYNLGFFTYLKNDNTLVPDMTIENFKIEGTVINSSAHSKNINGTWELELEQNKIIAQRPTGILVGKMDGRHILNNITVQNFMVNGQGSSGALVGGISKGSSKVTSTEVQFTNCKVIGDTTKYSSVDGIDTAGGFIGYTKQMTSGIVMKDCSYQYISVQSSRSITNAYPQVGGMVGYAENFIKIQSTKSIENGTNSIIYSDFGYIGGLIGETKANVCLSNVSVREIEVASRETEKFSVVGGMIGMSNAYNLELECTGIEIKDSLIYVESRDATAGGIVGLIGQKKFIVGKTVNSNSNIISGNTIIGGAVSAAIAGSIETRATNSPTRISNMKVENNKIMSRNNHAESGVGVGRIVGGLFGKITLTAADLYVDNVNVSKNVIATISTKNSIDTDIGGIVGKVIDTKNTMKNYFSKINLVNNYYGYIKSSGVGDEKLTKTYLKEVSTEELGTFCRLLKANRANASNNDAICSIEENVLEKPNENEISFYSNRVGKYIGQNLTTAKSYFIGTDVVSDDAHISYQPVTEVAGVQFCATLSDMYQYRDTCYIVEVPESFKPFTALQDIWTKYNDSTIDRRAVHNLYDPQRISGTTLADIKTMYEGTYYKDGDYVSYFKNSDHTKYPMVIFNPQYGEINTLVKSYLSILTNRGDDILDEYITVKTKEIRREYDMNTKEYIDTEVPEEQANPSVKYKLSNDYNPTYQKASFVYNHDDTYDADANTGTFTMVEVTYGWDSPVEYLSDGVTKLDKSVVQKVTVQIPIHVEKVLRVENNTRFVEGKEFSAEKFINGEVKTKQQTAAIDVGTTYTLYTEFAYNSTRTGFEDTNKDMIFSKVFYLDKNQTSHFQPNTRLTLIDLDNKNKAYYYEVLESCPSVAFNKFKPLNVDQTGLDAVNYVDQDISKISNVDNNKTKTLYAKVHPDVDMSTMGVERFLVIVDTSKVVEQNKVYRRYIPTIKEEGDNVSSLINTGSLLYNNNLNVEILERTGFKLSFSDTTSINGEAIKQTAPIDIDFEYKVEADSSYWEAYKKTSNNSYLEVAVSLKKKSEDGLTETLVGLPPGTKVVFNSGTAAEQTINASNSSYVYYYKDQMSSISLKDIAQESNNTNLSISKAGTIQLDFTDVDFTNFEEGAYVIHLDLIETKIADFPMSGGIKDSVVREIGAVITRELGFSITPDNVKDITTNIYNESAKSKEVPFTLKLDFSELLKDELKELLTQYAKKKYTLKLSLQEKSKTGDTTTYIEYPGTSVEQKIFIQEQEKQLSSKFELELTEEEIKTGTANTLGEKTPGIIVRPYKVNISALNEVDLSNYKVEAKLVVSDATLTDEEFNSASDPLTDYFIFNIAKIKTDSDN